MAKPFSLGDRLDAESPLPKNRAGPHGREAHRARSLQSEAEIREPA